MKKSLKRIVKKVADRLTRIPAPLNNNKGPCLPPRFHGLTKKRKRRKCHITPKILRPQMKWKEVHEEGLSPGEEYEPWNRHNEIRNPHQVKKKVKPWNIKIYKE